MAPRAEETQTDAATPLQRMLARLRDEPGVLVTLVYVAFVVIGGTYRWVYYWELGLNMFDYASASDAFLWAFQEPRTFGITVATGVIVLGATTFNRWSGERWPWLSRLRFDPRTGSARVRQAVLLTVAYFALLMVKLGEYNAQRVLRGEGDAAVVTAVQAGTLPPAPDGATARRVIIAGQTSGWLIAWLPPEQRIVAMPISNVASVVREVPEWRLRKARVPQTVPSAAPSASASP
jgi:hypothetical protein